VAGEQVQHCLVQTHELVEAVEQSAIQSTETATEETTLLNHAGSLGNLGIAVHVP
jgi:hypothetical protein